MFFWNTVTIFSEIWELLVGANSKISPSQEPPKIYILSPNQTHCFIDKLRINIGWCQQIVDNQKWSHFQINKRWFCRVKNLLNSALNLPNWQILRSSDLDKFKGRNENLPSQLSPCLRLSCRGRSRLHCAVCLL